MNKSLHIRIKDKNINNQGLEGVDPEVELSLENGLICIKGFNGKSSDEYRIEPQDFIRASKAFEAFDSDSMI